jgi:predicted nucleic acid-binding Zn ribbon protein
MKKLGSQSYVGDALKRALKEYGLDRGVSEQSLINSWADLVDPAIANNTRPVRFRQGTLVVETDSAVWRQELTARRSELIALLNEKLGAEIVEDILFR